MIFRRISQAIRRQDWFTVLIEICIVVIGLLIGLQINNWNEARAERVEEMAFIDRLAVDVDRARSQLSAFVVAREERLAIIAKIENKYFGSGQLDSLSESECTEFVGMDMISQPPVAVPSITEAFAGGKIDLITEAQLIQALIMVQQGEDRLRTIINTISAQSIDLSKKYPQLITLIRATDNFNVNYNKEIFAVEGYQMAARCHFLETTPEPAFLSDMVRGLQINQWYVTFLERHLERLDELAGVLDNSSNQLEKQ